MVLWYVFIQKKLEKCVAKGYCEKDAKKTNPETYWA